MSAIKNIEKISSYWLGVHLLLMSLPLKTLHKYHNHPSLHFTVHLLHTPKKIKKPPKPRLFPRQNGRSIGINWAHKGDFTNGRNHDIERETHWTLNNALKTNITPFLRNIY